MSTKSKLSKNPLIKFFGVIVDASLYSIKCSPALIAVFVVITVINSTYDYLRSFLDAKLIDSIIKSANLGFIIPDLLIYLGLLLALLLFSILINRLSSLFDRMFYGRFDSYIENDLSKTLANLDFAYFDDANTGKLITKARQNSYRVRQYFRSVVYIFATFISLIISSIILVRLDYRVFMVLLVSYIPITIVQFKTSKAMWGIWDMKGDTRIKQGHVNYYLARKEFLSEIKAFGIVDYLLDLQKNFYNAFLTEQVATDKKRFVRTVLADSVGAFAFAFAYYVIITKAVNKEFSVGLLTFYIAIVGRTSGTISSFFGSLSKIYDDTLYVQDYFKLLKFKNKIEWGNADLDFNSAPLIEIKNIWFKYPNSKKYIFKDFSLTIQPGEKIAIVGENGAGKTTMLNLILRFYEPEKGEILINGKNIKEYNNKSYLKLFALLTQAFNRYYFDSKTNIGIGDIDNLDLNSIIQSSKQSGAHKFISKYEKGYEQILSKEFEDGIEPSTGQWQKIALARAFFKNSPVLILDEPTSAIDPKAEYQIFEKLFDFAKEKTVLIISHRFSTVRNADRIIVLDGGCVVEEGSHKQLLEKNGIYKEAYDLQKKGYEDV